jgi:hypothetical protein
MMPDGTPIEGVGIPPEVAVDLPETAYRDRDRAGREGYFNEEPSAHSIGRPAATLPHEVRSSRTKIVAWLDVSQIAAASLAQITQRFFREAIEAPRLRVRFKLAVPGVGVERGEPSTESGQFFRRKTADRPLNLVDRTHARKDTG